MLVGRRVCVISNFLRTNSSGHDKSNTPIFISSIGTGTRAFGRHIWAHVLLGAERTSGRGRPNVRKTAIGRRHEISIKKQKPLRILK